MTWQEQVGISEMFIEFHHKYRTLDSITSYRNFLFEILLYYEDNVLNTLTTGQSELRFSQSCERPVEEKSDDFKPSETDLSTSEPLETTDRKAEDFPMGLPGEDAMQNFPPGLLPVAGSDPAHLWPLAGGSSLPDATPFSGGFVWKREVLEPEELEAAEENTAMEAAAAAAAAAAATAAADVGLSSVVRKAPKPSPAATRTGKHQCSLCLRHFRTRFTLSEHWRQHTGEKPFPCHLCAKRFKWRSSLSAHLRIHAGVRAHVCWICGRAFTEKTAMMKHVRIHNSSEIAAAAAAAASRLTDAENGKAAEVDGSEATVT